MYPCVKTQAHIPQLGVEGGVNTLIKDGQMPLYCSPMYRLSPQVYRLSFQVYRLSPQVYRLSPCVQTVIPCLTLLQSGMAFFKRMYTGGPMFYLASLMPCLWQLIKHPSRPVYLMTWTISYQSYLFTAKNVTTYPRYDLPEVPEFERR